MTSAAKYREEGAVFPEREKRWRQRLQAALSELKRLEAGESVDRKALSDELLELGQLDPDDFEEDFIEPEEMAQFFEAIKQSKQTEDDTDEFDPEPII